MSDSSVATGDSWPSWFPPVSEWHLFPARRRWLFVRLYERDVEPPAWFVSSFTDQTMQNVNVNDFGAKGDGVTNDGAAIQRAIDATEDDIIPPGAAIVSGSVQLAHEFRYLVQTGRGPRAQLWGVAAVSTSAQPPAPGPEGTSLRAVQLVVLAGALLREALRSTIAQATAPLRRSRYRLPASLLPRR